MTLHSAVGPLFTVSWLQTVPNSAIEQLQTDDDLLAALAQAGLDRGDRSFHEQTGLWFWLGTAWRLRDTAFFLVHPDNEQVQRTVDWLLSRGWPDDEDPMGWVFLLTFEDGKEHKLGSTKRLAEMQHVNFAGDRWVIAEKWAVNLSKVVQIKPIYGKLSVLHDQWA